MSIERTTRDARPEEPPARSGSKLARVAREELDGLRLRLLMARLALALLPEFVGLRLRPRLLRLAGLHIGRGTVMAGTPQITGGPDLHKLLRIGRDCWFNVGCFLDVRAEVTIGDRVQFGQQVMILTHTHEVGGPDRRSGKLTALPVRIGPGAWLGARSTILPGITIGEGAIVGAGAVVAADVPAGTVVGGVPAKVIRELD